MQFKFETCNNVLFVFLIREKCKFGVFTKDFFFLKFLKKQKSIAEEAKVGYPQL